MKIYNPRVLRKMLQNALEVRFGLGSSFFLKYMRGGTMHDKNSCFQRLFCSIQQSHIVAVHLPQRMYSDCEVKTILMFASSEEFSNIFLTLSKEVYTNVSIYGHKFYEQSSATTNTVSCIWSMKRCELTNFHGRFSLQILKVTYGNAYLVLKVHDRVR